MWRLIRFPALHSAPANPSSDSASSFLIFLIFLSNNWWLNIINTALLSNLDKPHCPLTAGHKNQSDYEIGFKYPSLETSPKTIVIWLLFKCRIKPPISLFMWMFVNSVEKRKFDFSEWSVWSNFKEFLVPVVMTILTKCCNIRTNNN